MEVAICMLDLLDLARAWDEVGVGVLLANFVSKPPEVVQVEKDTVEGYAVLLNGIAANNQDKLNMFLDVLEALFREKCGREILIYKKTAEGTWVKWSRIERRGRVQNGLA